MFFSSLNDPTKFCYATYIHIVFGIQFGNAC
jgi:hypothetical protein